MKTKFFLFLVVLCTMILPAFGQKLDTRIANTIQQSEYLNPQVVNQDVIQPGWKLQWKLSPTSFYEHTVAPGEFQYQILGDFFRWQDSATVRGDSIMDQSAKSDQNRSIFASSELPPWWVLCILGAVVLLIILVILATTNWKKLREKPKGKFSTNPATEGDPFVPGGVTSENVYNHFRTLFPGAIFKDMQRKFVSTPGGVMADVEFADNTHAKLSFRNEPGWVAMVSTDGGKRFNQEIVFEACGNPINRRKSLKNKNLIISDGPINFGDEPVQQSVPSEKKLETEKSVIEKQEPEKTEADPLTALWDISSEHTTLADKFLKTHSAWKVTMKFENSEGKVETIFETRHDQQPVGKKSAEKEK